VQVGACTASFSMPNLRVLSLLVVLCSIAIDMTAEPRPPPSLSPSVASSSSLTSPAASVANNKHDRRIYVTRNQLAAWTVVFVGLIISIAAVEVMLGVAFPSDILASCVFAAGYILSKQTLTEVVRSYHRTSRARGTARWFWSGCFLLLGSLIGMVYLSALQREVPRQWNILAAVHCEHLEGAGEETAQVGVDRQFGFYTSVSCLGFLFGATLGRRWFKRDYAAKWGVLRFSARGSMLILALIPMLSMLSVYQAVLYPLFHRQEHWLLLWLPATFFVFAFNGLLSAFLAPAVVHVLLNDEDLYTNL
jgi:hypothetical protein